MNDFADFLRSLGFRPGAVVPDGRWKRCATESKPKKKNGAYKLVLDGSVGFAQDWETMSEPVIWRAGEKAELPHFDRDAHRRSLEDARIKRQNAIRAARSFYADCEPLRGGHPYLESHGLDMTGCYGLKIDRDGWMVVPARKGHSIMSLQRISPEGEKRFWPGAPVSGTTYRIEKRGAAVTVLCEGLATGLAVYACVPNPRVIVAWSTGNLSKIELPPGLTVIAADNDHGTEERTGTNPGIEAAENVAAQIGCGIAYPIDIKGTDWSDYRKERMEIEMSRRLGHETRGRVTQKVEAEIRGRIMAAARFVA